jgi:hypothetical protein
MPMPSMITSSMDISFLPPIQPAPACDFGIDADQTKYGRPQTLILWRERRHSNPRSNMGGRGVKAPYESAASRPLSPKTA